LHAEDLRDLQLLKHRYEHDFLEDLLKKRGRRQLADPMLPPAGADHHPPILGFQNWRRLGAGQNGEVWQAWRVDLQREEAIKILYDKDQDPARWETVLSEARAAARVRHPNVCQIYEVSRCQAGPYIRMEFIKGKPLDQWAATRQPSVRDLA